MTVGAQDYSLVSDVTHTDSNEMNSNDWLSGYFTCTKSKAAFTLIRV